jgi:putative ABC transport system permease protein
MRGLFLLSWRHLSHHKVQSLILALCIAVPVFLPLTTEQLVARYEASLTARAETTPLVMGPRGNRFDLTLAALYFRQGDISTIPYSEFEKLSHMDFGLAIPLHTRYAARSAPLVGTSLEYFAFRGLRPAQGTLPLRLGDCVLGASVAERLGLGPGDHIFSDQRELYDISKPPALKMRITGVLAPSGGPDDTAVFCDVKTTWIIDGHAHGHQAADELPEKVLFGKKDNEVRVNPAVVQYQEVTDENFESWHFHEDTRLLPLSAILVDPPSAKKATILKARITVAKDWRMDRPREVIDELLRFVFQIKRMLDTIALVLGICTLLLLALIVALSMRLRHAEMLTLENLGCSRGATTRLYAYELGMLLSLGLALALGAMFGVLALLPDLVRTL